MASGLLSLKWNNHRSTFFHVLSSIRSKESYCDATLACDGRFYPVHKLVLSTCSEYFEQIFERTQCKHPVIVLKDIKYEDLEALMNYMYVGEVNVLQEKLSGLIKAAECLKIKGLAVPDEDPFASKENRRNQHRAEFESPRAKRRRREDSFPYEERLKNSSVRERPSPRERQNVENLESVNLASPKATELNSPQAYSKSDKVDDAETIIQDKDNSQINSKPDTVDEPTKKISSHKRKSEMSLVETNVKAEPPDIEIPDEEDLDSKENLHSDLGYDPSGGDQDSVGGDESGSAHGGNDSEFSENVMESAPQSVEDVVAQALPSSSNFQGNSFSMWEGDSSLQNFPGEGFSGENSQGRQMVKKYRRESSEWEFDGEYSLPSFVSSDAYPETSFSFSDEMMRATGRNCPVCHREFPSPSHMRRHLRIHTGEKPFRCTLCTYQTGDKGNLDKHQKMHTGERPFPCPYCPYRATQKIHLIGHMRGHGVSSHYKCAICDSCFLSQVALDKHTSHVHPEREEY